MTTEVIAAVVAAAGVFSGLLGAYLNHLRNQRLDTQRASTRERRDNVVERQQAVEHYDKLADRLEKHIEEIGKTLKETDEALAECKEHHAACEREQMQQKLEMATLKGRLEELSQSQKAMMTAPGLLTGIIKPVVLTGKPELTSEEVEEI